SNNCTILPVISPSLLVAERQVVRDIGWPTRSSNPKTLSAAPAHDFATHACVWINVQLHRSDAHFPNPWVGAQRPRRHLVADGSLHLDSPSLPQLPNAMTPDIIIDHDIDPVGGWRVVAGCQPDAQ